MIASLTLMVPSAAADVEVVFRGNLTRKGTVLGDALLDYQEKAVCIDMTVPTVGEDDNGYHAADDSFSASVNPFSRERELRIVMDGNSEKLPDGRTIVRSRQEVVVESYDLRDGRARIFGGAKVEVGNCGGGCVLVVLVPQQNVDCAKLRPSVRRIELN